MNHGLAKQLKEAGFNQPRYGAYIYPDGDVIICSSYKCACPRCYNFDNSKLNEAYVPSLSELIQACGDRFMSVYKDLVSPPGWGAAADMQVIREAISAIGKSPEEAVAKLWLKLQEK